MPRSRKVISSPKWLRQKPYQKHRRDSLRKSGNFDLTKKVFESRGKMSIQAVAQQVGLPASKDGDGGGGGDVHQAGPGLGVTPPVVPLDVGQLEEAIAKLVVERKKPLKLEESSHLK